MIKQILLALIMMANMIQANALQSSQKTVNELGIFLTSNYTQAEEYARELQEKNPFRAPDERSLSEKGITEFQNQEIGQFVNQQRFQNPAWLIGDKDRLWEREQGNLSCHLSYHQETCIEHTQVMDGCMEYLMVDVEQPSKETFDLEIYASSYAEKKTTFYNDLRKGILSAQNDANSAHGWSNPPLASYDCQRLSFAHVGYSAFYDATIGGSFQTEDVVYDAPTMPTCSNGLTTSFSISQTHHKKNKWKNRGVKHLFKVTYLPPLVLHDHWTQNCMSKVKAPKGCNSNSICLEGPSKKNVSGVEVLRDCWKRKMVFHCPPSVSQCQTLRANGCEQVKTECIKKEDDMGCTQQEITFKCPKSSCETKKEHIDAYCKEGDCFEPQQEALGSFEKAISHLTGVTAAGHDVNTNQIFKGQAMACRKFGIGFSNCCQDKGWGQDLHLTSCKEEEKLLGVAKEAKRVIEVGEYCDSKIVGECVEKKKSYCVYPSKLARIIQQGAINQMGRSLGEPDNPVCLPLTPQDLQTLDWNKIDFSEIYEEIRNKTILPNEEDLSKKIHQAVNSHLIKENEL